MRQYGWLVFLLIVVATAEAWLLAVDVFRPLNTSTIESVSTAPTIATLVVTPTSKPPASTQPTPPPGIFPQLVERPSSLTLTAKAWLVVYEAPSGQRTILAAYDQDQPLPIASVTKLVTAVVAKRQIDPRTPLALTTELTAASGDEAAAATTTQIIAAGDLLYPLLIESNNNAANALASVLGRDRFVVAMNDVAAELGLSSTHFVNPHGLDPGMPEVIPNEASAADLVTLLAFIDKHYPGLLAITRQPSYALRDQAGEVVRSFTSTNHLLAATYWPAEVLGGKTGQTVLANKNLVLLLHDQLLNGQLYSVVLGANDNFAATKQLLDWVYQNYRF